VNLSDAPNHPKFSYRPENRRRPLSRLPRRADRARRTSVRRADGAKSRRGENYAEEEVEALQTVAMVLARSSRKASLFNVAELDEPELLPDRPRKFGGEGCRRASPSVTSCCTSARQSRAHDRRRPTVELHGLKKAIAKMRESVDHMLDSSELDLTGESREVDSRPTPVRPRCRLAPAHVDAIRTGLTAEASVERVQDEMRLRSPR